MTERPEFALLKDAGYHWDNSFDIIKIFEKKISSYTGAPYVTVTDCCTHSLELCLRYKILKNETIDGISLPANTYISVPMMLKKLKIPYKFEKKQWEGFYYLEPTNVIDMAIRFNKDCYIPNSYCCLSFGNKKVLKIYRGGAILTDNIDAHNYFQLARSDGRDLGIVPWTDQKTFDVLGFHYNLSIEDCGRGILLMDALAKNGKYNKDSFYGSTCYPDLSKLKFNF